MVWPSRGRLLGLLLLVVRHIAAVGLCVLDLVVIVGHLGPRCESVTCLARSLIGCRSIAILCCLGACLGRQLSLLLARVDARASVVDALEEEVDVSERLEVNYDFNDGAQRHYSAFLIIS